MLNKIFLQPITRSRTSCGYKNIGRLIATQVAEDLKTETEPKNYIENLDWNSAIPYEQIPGPSKWKILNYFLPGGKFYKKPRHYISKALQEEYGEIVKIPGSFKQKDAVFVFNPNYFEKIYRHDGIWPSRRALETLVYYRHELRPELFKETGTLLTTNGEEWGKLRSTVNPIMMQPKTIRTYVPRMDKTTKAFIERIKKIRNPNTLETPDNFEIELNTWALEQICLVGLDSELGLIGNEKKDSDAYKLIQAISTIFEIVADLEFKPSIWKYYKTPKYMKVIKAYDVLTDISLKYIDEAFERYKLIEKDDKRNENEKSIVERLIKINKKIAVIMAIEMFFAGVDTTSTTFAALMLSLAKNPEKQEILRQEIRTVLPDRDTSLTEQKLKNLPYLRAVIKESVRLYPVVHEHARTTNVNFVLGKYQIPKDTQLMMYGTHFYNDENYFSEPNKFIPERWLRNQDQSNNSSSGCPVTATKPSNPFVYLPFGFGNRMCVGKRLVDMELEILLARMVRNFNIEYKYDDSDLFELKLIYTPSKPLKFKLNMMSTKKISPIIIRNGINVYCNKNFTKLFATQVAQEFNKDTNIIKENLEWDSAIPYEKIPGPSKLKVLSYFLPGGKFYKKSRSYIGRALNQEYGDLVKIPGSFKQRDVVFAFNPDYSERIYRHDGIWPSRRGPETLSYYRHELRPEIFKETGTLLTTNGEEWGKLRSTVNPIMMQPKTIRTYVPRMDKTTKKFIERVKKIRDPNTLETPDNFEIELNTWALEQICLVGLDSELGLIGNEKKDSDAYKLIQAISTIFEIVADLEFKPSIWKYYKTPKYMKVIKAYDVLTDISLKYIDKAFERYKLIEKDDKRNENEKSIVERLIKINKKIAVIMAIEMFFAGVDTTSTTFAALMLSLAKNPEKQEILRQEIRTVLPDRDTPLTEQKLKNLPYLRAVIKESVRLYPVVHEHARTTNVNFVLGKYQIPKGTDVLMVNTFYYNDENYFSEPNKLIPERWLRNQDQSNNSTSGCPVTATKPSNPFVYLPFGFGNRMCVGKRLVDMELEILLARMVRNFNIEYNYDDSDIFELKLIYTPVKPLKFKLIDIENYLLTASSCIQI
ncbi:uncharacterized protein LOC129605645 [Condylostylus longicornis]|uniref:uncharacterized protein LOC129605645 n=1 Tax=Condylostylus longicornis TaxID=2530218 RepID=UPI00244DE68D|nr:uncharacterized protein LOC129605645 [Condylostylus longicornis]